MKYRRLGRSGLEVSAIGLGTDNFGPRQRFPYHMDYRSSAAVIDRGVDMGINMIDTANIYGDGVSEEHIGRALEGRRHRMVLATKVTVPVAEGPNRGGSSRKHIMDEVEGSLGRLRTDYIDLYQMHDWDPNTPIEETLRALDDLVRSGKVRYIGCSNYSAWRTCEALWMSRTLGLELFVSSQPPYSMMDREVEEELLPFCRRYGVGVLPYFPLADGFLTGKYRRGQPPPPGSRLDVEEPGWLTEANFDILEGLERFAEERGRTVLELAFAWLLSRPEVSSVIAGATTPEQVEANAGSHDWELSAEELAEIGALLEPRGSLPA